MTTPVPGSPDNETHVLSSPGSFICINSNDIIPYDFADFKTFYARHGFARGGDVDVTRPTSELNYLIQSWLYLGVLAIFLGRPLTPEDHKTLNEHGPQELLQEVNQRLLREHVRTRESPVDYYFKILYYTNWMCDRFDMCLGRASLPIASSCLAARILTSSLSIILLPSVEEYVQMLQPKQTMPSAHDTSLARSEYSNYRDRFIRIVNPCPIGEMCDNSQFSVQVLSAHMRSNSWCCHQIRYVLSSFDYATCAYLAYLKRSSNRSHDQCDTAPRCVADNSHMEAYVTRHATSGCSCAHIATPLQEIVNILKRGRIPLISINESNDGQLQLQVCERTAMTRYVAVSHVWADGFGNPANNSLPRCVLRQLRAWLQKLPLPQYEVGITLAGRHFDAAHLGEVRRTPWFWMDTLCIPVAETLVGLRVSAINDMATIYAGATQTLVLDTELLSAQERTFGSSAIECLARIAFSTWSRRSWTFQEGALGPACVFQLDATAVDVSNQWSPLGPKHTLYSLSFDFPGEDDPVGQHTYRLLYDRVWNMLQSTHANITDGRTKSQISYRPFPKPNRKFGEIGLMSDHSFAREGRHHGELFVRVWNELQHRSTTQQEDIHIIMANLLELDARQVMSISRDQRMANMIRSIDGLPFSIFYSTSQNVAPSLPPSLRWLPEEPNDCKLLSRQFMYLTKHGFSSAVYDCATISLFLPGSIGDVGSIYHKQLNMLFHFRLAKSGRHLSSVATPDKMIVVFPKPHVKTLTGDSSQCPIVVSGACFKVLGYSMITFGGKKTRLEGSQAEHLHVEYYCPILVQATLVSASAAVATVAAEQEDRPAHRGSGSTSSPLLTCDYQSVPDAAYFMVACELHKYTKLPRRQVSTVRLTAFILYIMMHFVMYQFGTALFGTIITAMVSAVRHKAASSLSWICIAVVYFYSLILAAFTVACCFALAHQERCQLLESFNFGRDTQEKRARWAWWIVKPLYVCLSSCVDCADECLEKSEKRSGETRKLINEDDVLLIQNKDRAKWAWAEENGIPKIMLDAAKSETVGQNDVTTQPPTIAPMRYGTNDTDETEGGVQLTEFLARRLPFQC